MRSLRDLFPRVTARRVWGLDGTPVWEFRFTSRTADQPVPEDDHRAPGATRHTPVRFVSSRGVEIGTDTLRIDQFHHRIRRPAIGAAEESAGPPEWVDVATALVDLAAEPDQAVLQQRVVARLARAHPWFRSVATLDISAARITGGGLGEALDGVFVWRAEGGPDRTYLVAPHPQARDVLLADHDLLQALIAVACPPPDAPLGELESRLREAITRLGVAAVPDSTPRVGSTAATGLVLAVDADPPVDRSDPSGERQKSESERALSEELAELARKVRSASAQAPDRPSKAG
jgi:hypothetical protein